MSDSTVALLLEKQIPIVTTFAPLVQQSQPAVAKKFGIPDWKIEELVAYEDEISEGMGHKGRSALIGLVARKP